MAFYFCYSSALDLPSLNQWKEQHGYADFQLPEGRVGFARDIQAVADFPSRFWGGRVMGLVAHVGAQTPGVVFEISSDKDWHVIRHKEGIVTGSSVEFEVTVELDGKTVVARAFTTHPSRASLEGPLSAKFFESLKRAYETWKLPTTAIAELK